MEEKIGIYTLLKYFRCQTTKEEEEAVRKFVSDDPDGSHAKLYKDARMMFEALVVNEGAGPVSSMPQGNRKVLRFLVRAAAVVVVGVLSVFLGGYLAHNEYSSEMRSYLVPSGKTMQMTLEDGTVVWMNGGSEIEVPVVFARKTRSMNLKNGEIYLKVEPDASRPFVVDTYAGEVEVLGTEFNLEADSEADFFSMSLVKGAVKVTGKESGGQIYYLAPNDVLSRSKGVWTRSVMANPESVTCWRDGLLDIANMPFDKLMEEFERAFDVRIVIEKKEMPQTSITRGKLRICDGVESALNILALSSDFEYRIDRTAGIVYIR